MSHRTNRQFAAMAALFLVSGSVLAEKLDFARLHADPPLSGTSAQGLIVAPDGSRVTFLQPRAENQDILDLWQIDIDSGERSLVLRQEDLVGGEVRLSAEEEARRQRLRIRAGGITNYSYDETGERLLIPLAGGLYIYEFAQLRSLQLPTATRARIHDCHRTARTWHSCAIAICGFANWIPEPNER